MKIMSLNGWGGKLFGDLRAYLEVEVPDVLCLQEVIHSPEAECDWVTYRDGEHVLPQRANFFSEIASALPEHVAMFCPAAQGVLWDGERAVKSQWGLATFVHSSLTITAQVQDFVHKEFSPHGYGDHPRSRNAHGVRLYDFRRDRSISILHMHGLRDLEGKMDTPARRHQAHRLLDLASQVATKGAPLIVCGDFNIEPQSETFDLLKNAGLTDLVVGGGFDGTRTSHYQKTGKFADYMLINEHVNFTKFAVVRKPEVSDHCPLLLTI